ncbi:MAG: hypothetical protein OXI88_00775 [Gammaproteobacteria bacterium]|nr:hypothetical protein [Gammaproteobacteria bacterium]
MQQKFANFFKKIANIFVIYYLSRSYTRKKFMVFLFFLRKKAEIGHYFSTRDAEKSRGQSKISGEILTLTPYILAPESGWWQICREEQ